jgi:hypothetical protein
MEKYPNVSKAIARLQKHLQSIPSTKIEPLQFTPVQLSCYAAYTYSTQASLSNSCDRQGVDKSRILFDFYPNVFDVSRSDLEMRVHPITCRNLVQYHLRTGLLERVIINTGEDDNVQMLLCSSDDAQSIIDFLPGEGNSVYRQGSDLLLHLQKKGMLYGDETHAVRLHDFGLLDSQRIYIGNPRETL